MDEKYYENTSFACGKYNPHGLQLRFYIEDEKMKADFTPSKYQEGYPNIMHGGLITTALDEVMAKAVNREGNYGLTARLTARFRKQARVGEKLTFEAWITKRRRNIVDLHSQALNPQGEIVCEAEARFMILGEIKTYPQEIEKE